MKYVEIFVKIALSESKLSNTDYALNPYRGCEHQCVYCYAPHVTHMPIEEWRNIVYVKRNIATILNKELRRKKGFVSVGTVTDAYQPAEKKYEITRQCLEVLKSHNVPISILTKSSLITRDLDIIKDFNEAHVGVTITTLDEYMRRRIEPNSSTAEDRLQVLEEFKGHAITYAFVGPVIPEVTDLEKIMHRLNRIGVNYVIVDKFRWKRGMHLPEFLKERINQGDYNTVKMKSMKLARKYDLRVFLDW